MALSPCGAKIDSQGRELISHGTASFPAACYYDDLSREEVPWHWHEEMEAALVAKGRAVFAAGGKSYHLETGQGIFVNSGVVHGGQAEGTGECRLHSIVFHPRLVGGSLDSVFWQDYIRPLLEDGGTKAVILEEEIPWQKDVLTALEDAWQACVQEGPGYEFQVREGLSRIVYFLAAGRAPQSRPSAKDLRDGERIKIMLQYIQEHFGEHLTMEDVAASASLSPSECLRCFHSTIGSTPIQYVKHYRIQRAARLLAGSHMKIVDIGTECGFQEMSYFARAFREIKGCTPSQYRKKAEESRRKETHADAE